MSIKGDMKKVVKAAVSRGWKCIPSRRNAHYRLEWVDGRRVSASLTPSDSHATKNFLSDVKRIENSFVDDV